MCELWKKKCGLHGEICIIDALNRVNISVDLATGDLFSFDQHHVFSRSMSRSIWRGVVCLCDFFAFFHSQFYTNICHWMHMWIQSDKSFIDFYVLIPQVASRNNSSITHSETNWNTLKQHRTACIVHGIFSFNITIAPFFSSPLLRKKRLTHVIYSIGRDFCFRVWGREKRIFSTTWMAKNYSF